MNAYEIAIAIQPEDVDELGHVNDVVYVRWVQEAAAVHWNVLSTPAERERLVWVVVRHEIDYKQPAVPGDSIVARTWVGPATRFRFERNTEILRASDPRCWLAHGRSGAPSIQRRVGRRTSVQSCARWFRGAGFSLRRTFRPPVQSGLKPAAGFKPGPQCTIKT